jgi:spore coat protein CotH
MAATVDTEDMVDTADTEATGPTTEVMEDMVDTEATTDRTMEDMAAMVDTGPMVDMDTTAKRQSKTLYQKTPTLPHDMTRNFKRTLATLMPVAFPSDTLREFTLYSSIKLI